MPINVPNLLTFARIVAVPIFVAVYLIGFDRDYQITTLIFIAAALTDWLDGYLARKLGTVSPFGAFLDPVADKLMVCTALVLLVSDATVMEEVNYEKFFVIAIIIIVGRELSVAALREWMAEIGERANIATTMLSKFKTVVQMQAIVLLLYGAPIIGLPIFSIGEYLLYLAALITLWTMLVYLRVASPLLTSGRDK